ncbi:hypothetical protein [Streptomyces europaeiscabiei]|uniref:hypothetical protein n=1 Tax=Streptomyces europaeiscabiei TaxID=146819 RepID=UPI0013C4A272|nr:hypothetical protein [Streptomyces europaeiscabiei]
MITRRQHPAIHGSIADCTAELVPAAMTGPFTAELADLDIVGVEDEGIAPGDHTR